MLCADCSRPISPSSARCMLCGGYPAAPQSKRSPGAVSMSAPLGGERLSPRRDWTLDAEPRRKGCAMMFAFALIPVVASSFFSVRPHYARVDVANAPSGESVAHWIPPVGGRGAERIGPGECLDLLWRQEANYSIEVVAVSDEGDIEIVTYPASRPQRLTGDFFRTLPGRHFFGAGKPGTVRVERGASPCVHVAILNAGYAPIKIRYTATVDWR